MRNRPEMSSIPQGAFAAFKARQALDDQSQTNSREKRQKTEFTYFLSADTGLEQPPVYSSKLMNSIWGLYNRYSVHNLKKNKNSADFAAFNNQCMS